jgi:hypothetical protein
MDQDSLADLECDTLWTDPMPVTSAASGRWRGTGTGTTRNNGSRWVVEMRIGACSRRIALDACRELRTRPRHSSTYHGRAHEHLPFSAHALPIT